MTHSAAPGPAGDPSGPGTTGSAEPTAAPGARGPIGADGGGLDAAVRTQGLAKRFGPHWAVAGIDLVVPRGSFAGLLGPNGAGKTTTLSMVTGLLRPDAGTAEVGGRDVWTDAVAVKARIGVLPEGLRLFERLSGRELLAYNGRLRRLPAADIDQRSHDLLRLMDLEADADKLVVDYSTGMRKKIGLAAALLHNPSVLFLDEPFEGVDPVSANTIREVLVRYTASGATVVFSSHVMELVERLCDWVTVMSQGRIVAQGTTDEVRGGRSLNDAFIDLVGGGHRQTEDLAWLGTSPGSSSG